MKNFELAPLGLPPYFPGCMQFDSNSFFEAFDTASQEQLRPLIVERSYAPGQMVFDENDPTDGLYLVGDGEVELFKRAGVDAEQVLALVGPNDYFGEMGILDGGARSTAARSSMHSVLGHIPMEPLMDLIKRVPGAAGVRFFRRVVDNLRAANNRYINEVVHKEKLQMVGAMAATVIHDIKSPVTGIRLVAELIAQTHQDEKTLKWCEMIRKQADRMVAMAQELLEFSRGTATLDPEVVCARALLDEFESLNHEYLRRHRIEWSADVQENVRLYVDRQRFLRVLQNLVGNAVEALGETGGRIDVVVAQTQHSQVVLTVRDNGPGIPEEIRERLFQPFVTKGKRQGSGLGMAIAKSIIEAHQGSISVETATGHGTLFTILLPLP
jgi:signal transduction histidine kinase